MLVVAAMGTSMRSVAWFGFVVLATLHISGPVAAQSLDDALRIYAVTIVNTSPVRKQFTGYGIYLGRGAIITVAHVVGRWPLFTQRVLIAGRDLAAQVVKRGSPEGTDLALLSTDEAQLPVGLRLRRNPLCRAALAPGLEVIDVIPEKTTRTRIISPLLVAPDGRNRFDTLIDDVEISGSGIFDAERKCLLGIVSAKVKVEKFSYSRVNRRFIAKSAGFAGHFVSATKIAAFLPPEFRP